jgi:hypothetical protein
MTSNIPAINEVYDDLQHVLAKLQAIGTEAIDDAALVPLANAIKNLGVFGAQVHAQIELRTIGNGIMLPGVVVKDAIAHRKWHDIEAARQLAYEQFGKKAFKCELLSPAGIEKLGDDGRAFVVVASYKPEAGKHAVY